MSGIHLPPDLALMVTQAQRLLLDLAARSGHTCLPSRGDVARHEAGHAIGAALMGGGVRSCTLRFANGAWHGVTEIADLPTWRLPVTGGGRLLTPAGAVASAASMYAGPIAERQRGRGADLANAAHDLGEAVQAKQVLRSAVLMASLRGAPPASEEALQPFLQSISRIDAAFTQWLIGALDREIERVDALAAKLERHGRLAAHEIRPLLRGVVPTTPEDLFNHLRQGLLIGPLPSTLPPAYRAAAAALGMRT